MGRRNNGFVTEKAHLRTDKKAFDKTWDRIWGKETGNCIEPEPRIILLIARNLSDAMIYIRQEWEIAKSKNAQGIFITDKNIEFRYVGRAELLHGYRDMEYFAVPGWSYNPGYKEFIEVLADPQRGFTLAKIESIY